MEAVITVIDRHFSDNEKEDGISGELKTVGTLEREGNTLVVSYNETVGEVNDCFTQLRIDKGRLTMMRVGKFSTSMIFESGKRHSALYETPYGKSMIGIYTNALFMDVDETGGMLDFAYTLDCNGDLVSENELKIFIEVKN